MAHDPKKLKKEVDRILDELDLLVERAAGGGINPDARAYWRSHYGVHFYFAIDYKDRSWEEDKDKLIAKATVLGTTARKLAGTGKPITRRHAKDASFEVDCIAELGDKSQFEEWCN